MDRRTLLQMMGAAAVVPFASEPLLQAQADGGTVYELRTYTCFPGKHPALLERFKTKELSIFSRLGMPGVGFWVPDDEPGRSTKLVYMLRHGTREAAKANWAKFTADPEWVKVKAESEKDGPLVDVHESLFLDLLGFSPKV
jgi:hypothetical protein